MRLTLAAAAVALVLAGLVIAPPAAAAATEVEVGVVVLSLGNYDVNKGTYTLDFYLWMRWDNASAPEGFKPTAFEFMNGRASSKELLSDETDPMTGKREMWWRVQANLYAEPDFRSYPYDTQTIEILIEDTARTTDELVYVPLVEESGLDEGFRAHGWRVGAFSVEQSVKAYSFDEDYSRLRLKVELSRETFSTTLKTLLPLVFFAFVSGLSFLLHPSKIAQRLGLGTSMVISAVLFHISQTSSLPPLAYLMLFDKLMLVLYAFLIGSLLVTILIAIDEDYWKESDHTRSINLWGALATVAASGTLLLYLLS